MTEADTVFEQKFPGKTALDVFPMAGDATECPKCGLEFKTLLARFCQHKHCPPREYSKGLEVTEQPPPLAVQLEWPGEFRLHDPDPTDHHSALFLVFPDGLMVNISCHAAEGMDQRRGEWIAKTLNDELRKHR